MSNPQHALAVSQQYVQENLRELAREVIDMKDGFTRGQHLSNLCILCKDLMPLQPLVMARSLIDDAALRKAAK